MLHINIHALNEIHLKKKTNNTFFLISYLQSNILSYTSNAIVLLSLYNFLLLMK